jgi:hypothetical protein
MKKEGSNVQKKLEADLKKKDKHYLDILNRVLKIKKELKK